MTTTTGAVPGQEERQTNERRRETNLTVHYGEIGISAVVAAIGYTHQGKNPAYAPVVIKTNSQMSEMAA
jgi:hypothetical protein